MKKYSVQDRTLKISVRSRSKKIPDFDPGPSDRYTPLLTNTQVKIFDEKSPTPIINNGHVELRLYMLTLIQLHLYNNVKITYRILLLE